MISIEQALEIISEQKIERSTSRISIKKAVGMRLSQDVFAPIAIPSFNNSAMDGYAVCGYHEQYEIVDEVAAGDTRLLTLEDGKAIRIFTGAQVPENTTAVIMQEKAQSEKGLLHIEDDVVDGKNVRLKGEELQIGELVFEKNYRLNPASIGLLASLGIQEVEVFDEPIIGLLTTGNELVQLGQVLESGQIYDSNSHTLIAAIEQSGYNVCFHAHSDDSLTSVNEKIKELLAKCDVLLISGGISVGEYDFVNTSLEENDVQELFYKVNQKPGKPMFFGKTDSCFVFGLPGNPGSALNCYYIYVRSLLSNWSNSSSKIEMKLALSTDINVKGIRPVFYRGDSNGEQVAILEKQGSNMLHSFAFGNAIVLLAPGKHDAGSIVTAWKY